MVKFIFYLYFLYFLLILGFCKVKNSSIFSKQLDLTHMSQFIVFVHYIANKSIKEEFLFYNQLQ